ncbi:hypothetical protein LNQ82_01725 [Conchiformibius steedae DSM 2580]|uniref:Uncharacterized protein n=1 Tax=Conchiformibius steedae DSM 2580 TaxID=1121352 RepID=A0AAE9HX05_9NEIS|nr:hypothetical protein [Conchiformibius steedae]QMT33266.1 hypothetical protein H3L98_09265 [Conchiformibius steedae]URD67907.1 hypothetical protein LNQ82_01725 [Conchiformibius steedae DSM 2580]
MMAIPYRQKTAKSPYRENETGWKITTATAQMQSKQSSGKRQSSSDNHG